MINDKIETVGYCMQQIAINYIIPAALPIRLVIDRCHLVPEEEILEVKHPYRKVNVIHTGESEDHIRNSCKVKRQLNYK